MTRLFSPSSSGTAAEGTAIKINEGNGVNEVSGRGGKRGALLLFFCTVAAKESERELSSLPAYEAGEGQGYVLGLGRVNRLT